jgi:hypothetical protein
VNADIVRQCSRFKNELSFFIKLFKLANQLRVAVNLAEMLNSARVTRI